MWSWGGKCSISGRTIIGNVKKLVRKPSKPKKDSTRPSYSSYSSSSESHDSGESRW